MAFKFLKTYKSQLILASSVTGIWLGYQWIPETVGLSWSEKRIGFYDGEPEIQELNDASLSLIDQVKADLRAQGVGERHLERCRFFKTISYGPMFNKGITHIKKGALIGIPFTFEMTLPQLIPVVTRIVSTDHTIMNWNSEAGHQYLLNVLLSDSAKKFAIAWQCNYVNSYFLIGKSFIGVSVFALYFFESKRRQLKLLSKERLAKIFERSQIASDRALGYSKELTDLDKYKIIRSYNIYLQVGLAVVFITAYHLLYYSYKWYVDKKTDRVTASLGREYLQGGVEYYEKCLKRNKAERELMDFGKRHYKENGDVIQGYVFSPYRPISEGRDYLLNLSEKQSEQQSS